MASRFPDFNPAENLQAMFARRLCKDLRQFDHLSDLKGVIIEGWEKIERKILTHLFESMKYTFIAVLLCKGGRNKYQNSFESLTNNRRRLRGSDCSVVLTSFQ